jgi:hypothetical protein
MDMLVLLKEEEMAMLEINHFIRAVETYGESAVSDVVSQFGSSFEARALIVLEGGLRLQRIIKFETPDGRTFKPRG